MELVEEKWNEILQRVKKEYDLVDIVFDTWLKPLQISSVEENTIWVLANIEPIGLNFIKKKYYLPLKIVTEEVTGIPYEIEFILPEQNRAVKKQKKHPISEEAERSNLNPNYTFESFVVGSNNRFAHSASLAVAESPGEIYNPLFLYGGVGLGKTHLMHSIAHYILDHFEDMNVLYVTSEIFTNDVIDGIRSSTMPKFREKYRNVDVLLVDDIQFIIGKESTQEEFFHTFNELHVANKQIIITSDRPPKEMNLLEERIRSRFEWGLLADIGSPDYETRMAILRKKVEDDGIDLSDDILNYIAINIKSNIREIEGALNKLIAYANLEKTKITMEIAIRELQNFIFPGTSNEITPQLIMEVVAEHFDITVDQIMSKDRSKEISNPRQIVMYLCKSMTSLPLDSIGKLIGGRDHSTIIHGTNKVRKEYNENESFRQTVDAIRKKINPNLSAS